MAISCFCLSWGSIAREINGSRSSGDRTDGLQGVRRMRAGTLLGSRVINSSRRRIVFAEWVASTQDGSNSCSLCFSLNCAPGKF